MTPVLSIDTDNVLALASQMATAVQELQSQAGSIQSNSGSMNWISPGRQNFEDAITTTCQLLLDSAEQLVSLNNRILRAVQAWETAAQTLGGMTTSGDADKTQNYLQEIDPDGKLKGQPELADLVDFIYDTLSDVAGIVFAKTAVKQLLDIIGPIGDLLQVGIATPEYLQLNKQLSDAKSHFGEDSTQFKNIQDQMFGVELDVLLKGWATLPIKASGKWTEAVELWRNIRNGKGIVNAVQ